MRLPPYLYRRPSGLCVRFTYRDADGRPRRHVRRCPTQNVDQAAAWALRYRLDVLEGIRRDLELSRAQVVPPSPTLGELADAYERHCTERGTRLDREKYRLDVLLAVAGRDRDAPSIAPADVLAWKEQIRSRRKPPLAASSLNRYITLLQAILNHGVRLRVLATNPVLGLGKVREEIGTPAALTVAQMSAVFAALDDYEAWRLTFRGRHAREHPRIPIREIVLVAYYTLARTGTILSLTWEQVDLEAGIITFPRTKNRRRVTAPIRPPLSACLRAWRAQGWRSGGEQGDANPPTPGSPILGHFREPTGLVFPSADTGRLLVNIRHQWHRVVRFANIRLAQQKPPGRPIPPTWPIYNLRHTGASHLASTGSMSAQAIAELMGDTSIRTVERHYFHLGAEALAWGLERAASHPLLQELDAAAVASDVASPDTN